MPELETYRSVHAMSLPLLDQDGNPRGDGKEFLVQGGRNVQLLPDIAERALRSGAVRELTDEEREELQPAGEPEEGSEVNGTPEAGPGAVVTPTPPAEDTDQDGKLTRPANGASKDKWVAFAQQEGLDSSGTRDEIRARYEQVEKLEAQ